MPLLQVSAISIKLGAQGTGSKKRSRNGALFFGTHGQWGLILLRLPLNLNINISKMSECAYLANANSLNKDHVVTTDLEHKWNLAIIAKRTS